MLALLKNKWGIVAGSVIVVIIVVYLYGKKSGSVKFDNVPLPDKQDWGRTLNSVESDRVRGITQRLHSEMQGLNFSYDKDIYREYAALSDKLFIAVYNDFNALHGTERTGTLRSWIQAEGGFWSFASKSFAEIQAGILSRMNSLNLQ